MEFFTVLPMRKSSSKQIEIIDADRVQVGFIQRTYKSLWDKSLHYSPIAISFLETVNIDGEDAENHLKIREQSFKSNLTKLKWDVLIKNANQENNYFLEDKTKIRTNPRLVYHKNNKEYHFKQDLFNRICSISLNDHMCATIRLDKKIPPSLRTITKTNDLTVIELIGIYYIMSLVY